ncbi:MAG: hypothetical protein H6Q05_102 [Acidobacteria bacterium]|nr:hypothetical protein [Acidobacteriota bacterium]
MSNLLLTYDPLYTRIALAALALLLVAAYLMFYLRRARKARVQQQAARPPASGSPDAHLFERSVVPSPTVAADLLRGLLIVLALVVAAGFSLILLPQSTLDSVVQGLLLRNAPPPAQERIALLYLGDETQGKEFRIRGVIRNISAEPIEKLDAAIRLYASDGTLLETAIVRMDAETVTPDATSTFTLSYPEYDGRFARYSLDFKLRQGDILPYKDMRAAHERG